MMSLLAGLGVASAQKVLHGGMPPTPIERKPVVPDSQPRAPATCLLQLPELTIVHEPASGMIQIASMGTVLSYGGGWDHRQVKPYLFHLRHQSWKGAFWKVNTSRREVTLVWGGLFGGIGPSGRSDVMTEIEGVRLGVAVDVTGGSNERAPDRGGRRGGHPQRQVAGRLGADGMMPNGATDRDELRRSVHARALPRRQPRHQLPRLL
jgi:hypothetical protein